MTQDDAETRAAFLNKNSDNHLSYTAELTGSGWQVRQRGPDSYTRILYDPPDRSK